VDEIMSGEVRWCYEDQPLDELMARMGDSRVRRIPLLSHDGAGQPVRTGRTDAGPNDTGAAAGPGGPA
jgi:CBS domain-containing protein